MYKISLIIPSIHPESWVKSLEMMGLACRDNSFQIIGVGPYLPPKTLEGEKSFRYLTDYGSPSRCLQAASLICEGEYITWCPDDARIENGAFDACVDFFEKNLTENDGICVKYSEGQNYTGNQADNNNYWMAYTHDGLRQPGVRYGWFGSAVFFYKKTLFDKFGGLDCSFEHINLNAHDLSFRIQAKGGRIVPSPVKVLSVDWNPDSTRPIYKPIFDSYYQNDEPLFKRIYSDTMVAFNREIKLDNWKDTPTIWKRRFDEK